MITTVQKSPYLQRLIDPFRPTMDQARPEFHLKADQRFWLIPTLVGAALLVVSLVGWAVDAPQFYFSYLIGWVFCLAVALGALFFVVVQHLTRARWSVVVRRIAESLMWGFPVLAVLAIPWLLGMHDLFHWTHEDLFTEGSPTFDPIIAGKHPYLNTPFFLIRMAVYFVAWTILAYRLYSVSIIQDVDPDDTFPARLRRESAWGLPVLAVTTAFVSYDLLLSLDPHWFSTIFGVYYFAGAFWVIHALVVLIAMYVQRSQKALTHVVTDEHYQDLGKWMFGFTVFWAYIAFSQYMLVWYGNLPEETVWFRDRLEHGWGTYSAVLLVAHFIIPFVVLLPRSTKRIRPVLGFMAVWVVVMEWFDLFWLSTPALKPEHPSFHWLDLTCWMGLFGICLGLALYRFARHSLVPQNDPYLEKSLHFTNT